MTFTYLNDSIISLLKKTGQDLLSDFHDRENLVVTRKGIGDFVSSADKKAETSLVNGLRKLYPDYGFLLEESGHVVGNIETYRWIIDPLDGTKNFIRGIPIFAISVALEINKEIVLGLVYSPAADELFYAEKGKGAFLNNHKINVFSNLGINNSFISIGTAFSKRCNSPEFLKLYKALVPMATGVRHLGCAALELSYVAAGRYELFCEMRLSYWDIAAGALIVKEAGGRICDFHGNESYFCSGNIIATNSHLFSEIHKIVTHPS